MIKLKDILLEIDYHSKLSRGHKPDYYQLGTSDFKPFDEDELNEIGDMSAGYYDVTGPLFDAGGRKYSSKLITLPAFLVDNNYSNDMEEICKGLILTGYFMKKFLYKDLGKDLPLNRTRLLEKIQTIK